jgi:hypothetical protein
MRSNNVFIEGTRFIFNTNFSGDPKRDTYGSSERKGNLIIPDPLMARELIDEGFNVKMTKPRDGEDPEEFAPTYYIVVRLSYRNRDGELKQWPPKVFLITEDKTNELNEDTVSCIDYTWVESVNVVLNKYENPKTNKKTLYIKTMEVYQRVEDDPILARHRKSANEGEDEPQDSVHFNPENEEDIPF